jgi:hypothetical protein
VTNPLLAQIPARCYLFSSVIKYQILKQVQDKGLMVTLPSPSPSLHFGDKKGFGRQVWRVAV